LRPRDAALLALVLAAFGASFLLHVSGVFTGRLRWMPLRVVSAANAQAYPVLVGARAGGPELAPELAPGDELLALQGASLRGASRFGVLARVLAVPGGREVVPLRVRTASGVVRDVRLPIPTVPWLWRASLLALSFAALGALTFWQARGSAPARLFLGWSAGYALHWSYLWGGSLARTLLGIAVFAGGVAIALPLALRTTLELSARGDRPGRWARAWPWLFAPVGLGAATWAFGVPLPPASGVPVAAGGSALFAATLLVTLARGFRRAGPDGRRQLKWVLAGAVCGLGPPLVCGVAASFEPSLAWLYELSLLSLIFIPVAISIAITRDHLFDVERLISASATYTLLSLIAVTALFLAVPRVANATSGVLDPRVTQTSLALALAAAVIVLRARLEPWLQRLLFRERVALERGAAALRQELTLAKKPGELLQLVAERLGDLLGPRVSALYVVGPDELSPVFVRGPANAPRFEPEGPLALLLAGSAAPLRVPRRRRGGGWRALSPSESSALEGMGIAVIAPVRTRAALSAFLCLGEKRSGDVYTETDLALIGSVTDKVSDELVRFEEQELRAAEREMSEKLRRYVPGAIAAELTQGEALRAGEREVTVLFVDVRGYTALVEGRAPSAIFELVSAYTQAVSRAVAEHGGTVVEFNGDGMMAVLGAPRSLADKERAALRAARAILAAVARIRIAGDTPLSVGIGIASGPAYVGSIQGVDRAIWTALGNTTNLASRLQTLTRDHGASIAVDEATYAAAAGCAEIAEFRSIGIVPIRGRTEPLEIFVLPLKEQTP
jgi:class 3 adenylate cyclase